MPIAVAAHCAPDIAPVSKGEFHWALAKNRGKMADVDDIVVTDAAAKRLTQLGAI